MSVSPDGYIEDARGGVDEVSALLYGSGNAEVAAPRDPTTGIGIAHLTYRVRNRA